MTAITTVDRSGWILTSTKDALRWWLIKTTGPMQRIRYEQTTLRFSVLSWVDSDIVHYGSLNDFQRIIRDGRWKICE